jgi:hypothetical protein
MNAIRTNLVAVDFDQAAVRSEAPVGASVNHGLCRNDVSRQLAGCSKDPSESPGKVGNAFGRVVVPQERESKLDALTVLVLHDPGRDEEHAQPRGHIVASDLLEGDDGEDSRLRNRHGILVTQVPQALVQLAPPQLVAEPDLHQQQRAIRSVLVVFFRSTIRNENVDPARFATVGALGGGFACYGKVAVLLLPRNGHRRGKLRCQARNTAVVVGRGGLAPPRGVATLEEGVDSGSIHSRSTNRSRSTIRSRSTTTVFSSSSIRRIGCCSAPV